ncbi:MAG: glycosyltransferase family 4 protein [Candidatus Thermoplasmatota archaeon]|nr:glycosyltransferase family 4 protein [Candidatus Thermoplasmatota archaeon]
MNVLIITPDIYPFQKGYGGRNPLNLLEAFSRLGHDTWLIASMPDWESFNMDSKGLTDHLEIVKLHSLNFIPRDFDYFFLPHIRDLHKIRKILRKRDYDIIILNDYFWSLSFISVLLMGNRNRSRTIMINHGIISPDSSGLKYIFSAFSAVVSRIFIPQFMGILSYSRRSQAAISEIVNPYDRLYIHSSCIDTKQFVKDFQKSLLMPQDYLEDRFGIFSNFIFSIGAISPHKGYENLVRSFNILEKQYPGILLIIAGKLTAYYETLKTLTEQPNISDKVKFIGEVSEDEKFLLLMKCSIFVIPSLSEGFGAGAMEANVLQVKVLATDTGAHREILAGNKFARIVAPGDENGLYEGMRDLYAMEEKPPRKLDMDKLNSYSCESLASYIISLMR